MKEFIEGYNVKSGSMLSQLFLDISDWLGSKGNFGVFFMNVECAEGYNLSEDIWGGLVDWNETEWKKSWNIIYWIFSVHLIDVHK